MLPKKHGENCPGLVLGQPAKVAGGGGETKHFSTRLDKFQNFVVKGVMVKILWTKVLPS